MFEELLQAGIGPNWIAGISIGAINGAIIAGNPPDKRVEKLRQFWNLVSSSLLGEPLANDNDSRRFFNETSAALVASTGVPGFFDPRMPPAVYMPPGTAEAISIYDTSPLRKTLLELVDFDLLNSGAVRYSLGAVQVRTGNMRYFDTTKERIGDTEAVPDVGGLQIARIRRSRNVVTAIERVVDLTAVKNADHRLIDRANTDVGEKCFASIIGNPSCARRGGRDILVGTSAAAFRLGQTAVWP